MNKTFKILLSLLAISMLVLAGCNVGTFSPELGGEDDFVSEFETNKNGIVGADLSTTGVDSTYPATLESTINQEVRIAFDVGVVDLNATSTIDGLTIYNLTGTAAATEVRGRGTPVSYTAEVIQTDANASMAVLTLNLTNCSETIEIHMDAASLTGNNGTRKLDRDNDNVAGEVEDDYIEYISGIVQATGTTAPTAITGLPRTPNAAVTTAAEVFTGLATGTNVVLTETGGITDTAGTYNFTDAILNAAYSLEILSNGIFTAQPFTGAYNTTNGAYTMTLATVADNSVYRVTLDKYAVYESAVVQGYTHRASYLQAEKTGANVVKDVLTVGTFRTFNNSDQGGVDGQPYIELTASVGSSYIDVSDITSTSVSIMTEVDTDPSVTSTNKWATVPSFTVKRISDTVVWLMLPEDTDVYSGANYRVTIQPTINDLGADRAVGGTGVNLDTLFIDSSNDDCVRILTGNF